MAALSMPASSSGKATLSYTVRDDSKLKCWNTMPMSRRASRSCESFSLVRSRPLTMTSPAWAG